MIDYDNNLKKFNEGHAKKIVQECCKKTVIDFQGNLDECREKIFSGVGAGDNLNRVIVRTAIIGIMSSLICSDVKSFYGEDEHEQEISKIIEMTKINIKANIERNKNGKGS